MVAAAVDIGSNSVHLLVAVVRGHRLEPLLDESVFLGLGSAVDERAHFGPALAADLAGALVHYADRSRELGASRICFVGTEPMRRASDAARVVRAVERESRVPVHVLSHEEEALLTLLGVTAGRPLHTELMVVDVGGGSSEFVVVAPGRAAVASGIRLGSARLTGRLVAHDPPTAGEVAALLASARELMAAAPEAHPQEVVVVGGTASNLVRLVPAAVLDRSLTRRRIRIALAALQSEPAEQAAARHAIRPIRARLLPAGAAIVGAILERYGIDRVHVSEAGIREGAVLAAAHAGADWRDRLVDLAHGWLR